MLASSKALQEDMWNVGKAKASGDTKTVCRMTSSILSTYQPMFKEASSCNSVSTAISLNKLIRTMEEMRRESKC